MAVKSPYTPTRQELYTFIQKNKHEGLGLYMHDYSNLFCYLTAIDMKSIDAVGVNMAGFAYGVLCFELF